MQTPATHLQGTKKRILSFSSTVAMLFALCLFPLNHAWAKTYNILVISSGSSIAYTKVIDTIRSTVASSSRLSKSGTTTEFSTLFLKNISTSEQLQRKVKNYDLLLTIGKGAVEKVTQLSISPPIVSTLIPKQSYDQYQTALNKVAKKTTAIFIDNPPERQILLANTLLGQVQRLGVLIGENSPHKKNTIRGIINKSGIKARIETVRKTDNIIRKLSHVLSESDAFLALPDAQIFNRDTAKNILLTTYRQRTPVIAYSASYVKAGALAAVYSTPQQIAEQTGNTIISILQSPWSFPKENAYPEDFEVSINKSVAKSLNIPTHSETKLKNMILKILRRNQ